MSKKIILDIVPLTRIPLTRNQSFAYLSYQKVPYGSLVSIPLFHRQVEGIVIGDRPDFPRFGNIQLKKINKIFQENFLDEKQIELAKFISDYYISPLGIVLKNFVPKRTKRFKNYELGIKNKIQPNIKLTSEQEKAVEIIIASYSKFKIQNSKFLVYGPAASGKTEVYIHSIAKLKAQDEKLQFLILIPELTLTPQAIERYGEYFQPEEIVVLHSRLSRGQFYANWQRIKSGQAKIIIGTRMAVFAPFKKLGLIVIDEEQDISFKQWDMNPRYDARTVSELISDIHKCPLILGSATPRVESYYQALNNKYQLLKLPRLTLGNNNSVKNTNIEIVDMRKERWNKSTASRANYSPISRKLQSEMTFALKHKMQVMLFINRQGMSSFSLCASCRTVLRCPNCDRALIYDTEGLYKCIHCSYKTSIIPHCSNCQGIIFRNIGLGTQKVEKEIKNLFPHARVARLDTAASRGKNIQNEVYHSIKDNKIDILIGTQMITKGWDLPRLSLVGIIDADALITMPDFFSSEKAYQNIMQVSGRVNRPGSKVSGTVIIQTYHPEYFLFQLINLGQAEKFYETEIAERKVLNLAPFGKIIKLIIQETSQKKAENMAKSVFKLLGKLSGRKLTISQPQPAYLSKIRGRYRWQIIIKAPPEKLPASVIKIIKALPSQWLIDIDPISIL